MGVHGDLRATGEHKNTTLMSGNEHLVKFQVAGCSVPLALVL